MSRSPHLYHIWFYTYLSVSHLWYTGVTVFYHRSPSPLCNHLGLDITITSAEGISPRVGKSGCLPKFTLILNNASLDKITSATPQPIPIVGYIANHPPGLLQHLKVPQTCVYGIRIFTYTSILRFLGKTSAQPNTCALHVSPFFVERSLVESLSPHLPGPNNKTKTIEVTRWSDLA